MAGKPFTIGWVTGSNASVDIVDIENVRLEYSPDNGTTYLPIAERVPNIGSYEWLVPYHASPHCLVRISSAYQYDDGNEKQPGFDLLYEFKFRVDGLSIGAGNDFTIRLGDAKKETVQNFIPSISFNGEANGKEYISFEGTSVELGDCKEFLRSWHTIQIKLDNSNRQVSILLDGKAVLENIPLSPMVRFSPAVSFVGGSGAEVAIDDLSVKINTADEATDNDWNILFNEDFERFIDRERAQLKDSGWNQKLVEIKEKAAESAGETDNVSIEGSSSNFGQSVRINSDGESEIVVVKSFLLPLNFPFDVSDKPFEIRYNEDMNRSISPISTGNERAEAYSSEMDYNAHGPYYPPFVTDAVTSSGFGQIQAVTVTYTDTYYIYAFDGKLLSEYDQTGSCVRDYIYTGNRLLAEYRPSTGKYYYYMSDQINSTRTITDDVGNVVYSEAYGPYGDVQKTWTKTYDPKQKFSGKEREGYSELDYFGARYFDNNSYRFISVDPIINKEGAISNPQLWNLYAYCGNNPITFWDPDGKIRKPGNTPPSKSWPDPPKNIAGKNPKWNSKGYWEGKNGRRLTWDDRSHGAGVDRGQGKQDGHWDNETTDERWDREGNPLGGNKQFKNTITDTYEPVDPVKNYMRSKYGNTLADILMQNSNTVIFTPSPVISPTISIEFCFPIFRIPIPIPII